MKAARALAILALALLLGAAARSAAAPPQTDGESVPAQVLVQFQGGPHWPSVPLLPTTPILMAASAASYNPLIDVWRLDLPPGFSVPEALARLRADPAVALAQPNYVYTSARLPNDPLYQEAQQPYYAAINAPAGWDVQTGSPSAVVAVLDGGVDIAHAELEGRIWTNSAEVPNGLDDDGNGCIDDLHGCDFLAAPPAGDIADVDGHGTFVAGIIGARADNGVGVAGMAWDVTLMPVRVLQPDGKGTSEGIASGIAYASHNGARIQNLSLALIEGGECPADPVVETALRDAHDQLGVTTVASAGNFNLPCVTFPASSPYTIAVGASGAPASPDTRADFSHWGPEIDVAAPGMEIVSTCPGVDTSVAPYCPPGAAYGQGEGTSFAAPIVSGLAALLISQDPSRTNEQVRQIIRDTARDLPDDHTPNWDGAGLVDVGTALGAGSAFALVDARAPAIDGLTFAVAVGDGQAPLCQAPFWQQPTVASDSLQGSFGVGQCASFWPPRPDRPWFLRASYSGVKSATVHAWSLLAGHASCAATDLPTVVPRTEAAISRIDCRATGPLANDGPEQATVIDPLRLPQRLQQDLRYATAQGDPSPSCLGGTPHSRSVWYRLPPTGARLTIAADTFGSDFNTVLAVYKGEPAALMEVTCNRNFELDPVSWRSRLAWRTDGVSTYYLMAAAYQSVPAGRLRLNLSPGFIPTNDSRSQASAVGPQDPYPLVQPSYSATSSPDDPPLPCAAKYVLSLWFSTSAGAGGPLTLDTAGSDYDTVIGVFSETAAGDLTQVACNDDASADVTTSHLTWQAQPGQEYLILVGALPRPPLGASSGHLGGVLRLRLLPD